MIIHPPNRYQIKYARENTRRIDHEYAIELTAYNSQQIVQAQTQILRLQAATAVTNLRALQQIDNDFAKVQQGIDANREHLGSIQRSVEAMESSLTRFEAKLDDANTNLRQIDESLNHGFSMIVDILNNISEELIAHGRTLVQISDTLRRPYETQAKELRDTAQKLLVSGENTEGRDRKKNWDQAMTLLQAAINNHIGSVDYVAWFQIGYLRWKHLNDLIGAEEAFDDARRLSAPKPDIYYLKSLRHLAYMQYLQERFEDAYLTIQEAIKRSRDHETLYDCARYAAKTARKEEAIRLLDECIELQPTTHTTMFAEEDFTCLR